MARSNLLVLWLLTPGVAAIAQDSFPEKVGPPRSMAALGDSITRAFSTSPSPSRLGDRPHLSWSTGNDGGITSHYTQLDALGEAPAAYNLAVSGSRMVDIGTQVTNTLAQRTADGGTIEYVTILMGGNDACRRTETGANGMTDVAMYRAQFQAALESLTGGLPDARIFVASVPDVYVLWDAFNICQSMLEFPTSTATADVERRARVRQRVIDFNAQLSEVCGQSIHCRYDQGGVFANGFTAADVSTADYFHPSLAGQIRLGSETWATTFDFTDVVAPVTALSVAPAGADDHITLTATDNVAVRGIEYRYPLDTRWTRYDAMLAVPNGETLTFRAVDVNGNIEASQSYKRGDAQPDAGAGDGGSVTPEPDAGDGTPNGDGGVDGPDEEPRGCNCGAVGFMPSALFGLLALLRLGSRRRR